MRKNLTNILIALVFTIFSCILYKELEPIYIFMLWLIYLTTFEK